MILAKMTGVKWAYNEDGAAYYQDSLGNDWYEFRNTKLVPNKPIIVVDESTNKIIMYINDADPTRVGLRVDITMGIYQLDSFPDKTWDEFSRKSYLFINGKVIRVDASAPVELAPTRSKEQLMADLEQIRLELSKLQ